MSLHPGIRPMMLLSTAHLTAATQAQLNTWCQSMDLVTRFATTSAPFFMGPTDYGWLVHCTDDKDGLPADLLACMAYAKEHNCHYLLFDSETVDTRDDLPVHEEGIA